MKWLIGIGILLFVSMVSIASHADDSGAAPAPTPINRLQTTPTTPRGDRPVGVKNQGAPNRSSPSSLDPSQESSMGAGVQIHFGKVKKEPVPKNDAGEEEDDEE